MGNTMTKVEVREVEERLKNGENVTLVDSRSADAWAGSDIKAGSAIRIPPDNAEEHIAEVSRDDYIVTYCT